MLNQDIEVHTIENEDGDSTELALLMKIEFESSLFHVMTPPDTLREIANLSSKDIDENKIPEWEIGVYQINGDDWHYVDDENLLARLKEHVLSETLTLEDGNPL